MFPLYSLLQTGFTHRKLGDGTEDSICLVCFATVRGLNDTNLAAAEAVHDCWQKNEAALQRDAALAKQA
jgi:hypothetical protein